ncbi:hypothetical protein PJL18_03741 [Paenarthrobacter nicotinovorans]|nr:hypothetical protein [Paenarthrobacter nicotinovorans]
MTFFKPAAETLCPVSVLVHRWRVSRTCISGLFRRSSARCTLTRALALAANAAKSGAMGEMRSGRAANKARSELSLRASSSLLSARIRDINPTLPPRGNSCPILGRPSYCRRRCRTASSIRTIASVKATGKP